MSRISYDVATLTALAAVTNPERKRIEERFLQQKEVVRNTLTKCNSGGMVYYQPSHYDWAFAKKAELLSFDAEGIRVGYSKNLNSLTERLPWEFLTTPVRELAKKTRKDYYESRALHFGLEERKKSAELTTAKGKLNLHQSIYSELYEQQLYRTRIINQHAAKEATK